MFKSARWRSEKHKVKIVFKLQFHATQVPQLKAEERLTISLVRGDVGKSTGKIEKALVLDGHCRWETPVYETVKFHQDGKSGKVNQRVYHLIVSTTGSTKSSVVGETSIDFADYVDAIKTCNVSLPLQNSNSKAMLHVSIQRQLEDNLVNRSQREVLKSNLSIEANESLNRDSLEEDPFGKSNRITELRRRASIESISTLSSFDSVSELDTLGEVGIRGDHQIHQNHPMHRHSESEWSGSSDLGISTDDSTNSSNDTTKDEVDKLKAEVVALARRADLSELELQSLRKQIVKETKRSQDLLKEVTSLKQERDSLKMNNNREEDPQVALEDLNSSLRLQLEKTQEANSELILTVQDLERIIGQRSKKVEEPTDEDDEDQKALDEIVKGHMEAKDVNFLEKKINDLYNDIEIYKRDKEDLEIQVEQLALDYEILKQENHDILYKLEQSHAQEQLKMQYDCSYELENQVERLEAKVKELEEELERQGERFEVDIEEVTRGKVEQEKRAIEAEEELRKTRLRNASIAGKIQDEFKRISEQMACTLSANEKMAVKAMNETRELRKEKRQVEELLMKANDKLRANRDEYEAKINELSTKTELKTKEMESIKDEKEAAITVLKSELETAIARCDKLKHVLSENESEMEKLRKEIVQVRSEVKKKEEEMENLEDKEDRIKLLEEQIKLKENALDVCSNTFMEKETDLKNRIEELWTRPDELSQVSLLKEQNELMEMELKEMQERYSDISLRFAEVEGERQKLVMTVRYLKNTKKT